MKKVLVIWLLLVALLIGCGGESKFELTGSEVVNLADGEYAALKVDFKAGTDVTLRLYTPDGWDRSHAWIEKGYSSPILLGLANNYEQPKAGEYVLTAEEEQSGKLIATYRFNFTGADPAVDHVSLTWTWDAGLGSYALVAVDFTLTNSGDLPNYIYSANITVEGRASDLAVSAASVLPGKAKDFHCSAYLDGILPGAKAFTLEISDAGITWRDDHIICTYSSTATPSV